MDSTAEPDSQRRADARRFRLAAWSTVAFVAVLYVIHALLPLVGDPAPLAVRPRTPAGLVGVLTAPLVHGSWAHLLANTLPLLVLGTLSLSAYPRASLRALPLVWLGSGLGVWLIGRDAAHLGASGVAHGLLWFVFFLGLLRRDRAAIAAALIAFLLYGGMLLTVLPQAPDISWESHLCGALMGLAAAFAWRGLDPGAPRARYSWEIEEAAHDDAERMHGPRPRPDEPRN
ncbi:rhomboid family intramembrane serine protease [Coralloluteibacterium stylophorae]|uniref:Rhomboid family intramembrane serine protease n=1 Tax=Coralloluteibacterium stylophorae TaxID=1776034 RepID=A0A8J7VS43_9GAMM|nr:rhomboid family intramembrane serine protease [Coralloluteibacterium stylophorae]MBS7458181.1 rhomboid family intramembrane serine protease [Coralloluteibacterium stylophorae]